jgi:hypothetical protein
MSAILSAGLSALGTPLAAGASRVTAKLHEVAPTASDAVSRSLGGIGATAHDASGHIARHLRAGFSGLSEKAQAIAHKSGEALAPVAAQVAAKVHALAPSLSEQIGKTGRIAGDYAKEGVLRAQALLTRFKPPRVEAENAVSSPARVGRFDLSQMLIIAGALLLICGGLMLGSGFLLRAGTPQPQVATASPSEPIAWLFEHPNLSIAERSVFAVERAPDGFRVTGFSIGAVNLSDDAVSGLGGVIKPDARGQELKLALTVEQPEGEGTGTPEVQAPLPEGAIPSQAQFKLVFLFPPEAGNGGMTPQEVLSAYGGLMLKVRYEMAGTEKSFIQYLPPSLLEAQLAEIAAEAKGS